MKPKTVGWQLLPVLLISAGLGYGQTANYGQSAPLPQVGPGTINYVEGQASLDGQTLSDRSPGANRLRPGQALDTGAGYVEVLLTPGAFLRVGNNSELRVLSAGLADTRTQLTRGTSILEVDQLIEGTHLAMVLNGNTIQVEKNGLYAFNAAQGAVRVLDGKVIVAETGGNRSLGKHDEVLLSSKHPLKKRNFDEKTVKAEPLYVWSAARSQDEAQASGMAAENADEYATAGSGWYWDPTWDFYGFWPAEAALYSPFGWGFYSPAFFGFGYGGGGYYGGLGYRGGYYGGHHPGWTHRPGAGWTHRPGTGWNGGWHGGTHVGGMNAGVRGYRGGGFAHSMGGGGFHGGGFGHSMGGGGFHGGGGRR